MSENENQDFEALRRLLAVKRHEVPPPGYYDELSARISRRVRLLDYYEEGKEDEHFRKIAPWVFRLIDLSQNRPGLVGAVSVGAFLFIALGIIYLNQPDTTPTLAGAPVPVQMGVNTLNLPQTVAEADFANATSSSNSDTGGLSVGTNFSLQPHLHSLELDQPQMVDFNK